MNSFHQILSFMLLRPDSFHRSCYLLFIKGLISRSLSIKRIDAERILDTRCFMGN